eukprot:CAMPEP_0202727802 /NCGR_PEP_ID=MMETSP1385-20130828/185306_1 /ASSEMBLY_ACC=CAM_ASM_000861 /TAXON_ID=933848 /ORGANISM="Elphidium margaritaceum" /LENGTH=732 /DNA_ID=CAMNT_0049394045 /DNA_START=32 /DNA_END=2227 /DNA_ORIENTATION=+
MSTDNNASNNTNKEPIDWRQVKRQARQKVLSDEDRAKIPLIEWALSEPVNHKGSKRNAWKFNKKGPRSPQLDLLYHGWATNDAQLIHKVLSLCQSKTQKFWIDNIKRALYTFKPPEHDRKTWDAFHELFKANALPQQYEKASVLIFPVIASSSSSSSNADDANPDTDNNAVQLDENSLDQSYEMFQKMVSNSQQSAAANDKTYNGPSLRCVAMLLRVCCRHLNRDTSSSSSSTSSSSSLDKNEQCLKIAQHVQSIVRQYNIDTVTTVSTGYFDALFEIFAANRVSIDAFNALFVQFYGDYTEYNQVVEPSTYQALKSYWTRDDADVDQAMQMQMDIHENLVADVHGYLYFDEDKKRQLPDVKIPKFYLSVTKNSEIWEQLRRTEIHDAAAVKCERKQLYANQTRAKKLGLLPAAATDADVDVDMAGGGTDLMDGITDEEQHSARRRRKYEQFVKFMLSDGGAEVVIDGANVGHMLLQDHFCFDFVDHVASYYAFVQHKKVRIIMCTYRVVNAENSGNARDKGIIAKWMKHSWLIQSPNILYDDVLWSIYTLHSCLVYNENVVVVTNDNMRDHALALHRIKGFEAWLQTKLCRVEVFKGQGILAYDPFASFTGQESQQVDSATTANTNTSGKRTLLQMEEQEEDKEKDACDADSGEPGSKKQKIDDGTAREYQGNNQESLDSSDMFVSSPVQQYNKFGYINRVYPYRLHPPCAYVLRPQYYRYETDENEHFIW